MDIDLRSKKVHFGNGVGPNEDRTLSLVSSDEPIQMHFLLTLEQMDKLWDDMKYVKRLFGKGCGKYEQKQNGK